MRKFQCLLFVLKRSYICYYIICMTVPLIDVKRFYRAPVLLANYISKKGFFGNYSPNLPANLITIYLDQ